MKLIACGDKAGNYFIWNYETSKLEKKFNRSGHKVEIVDWTPDGKYLATAGNDPFIRFFRTKDILSKHRIYTALQVHAGDQAEYLRRLLGRPGRRCGGHFTTLHWGPGGA